MKKILAVVTALAIAISSLCVFVFATESDNIISSSSMYSGYYNDYTMGADGTSFSAVSGGSQIGLTLGTTVGDGESISLKVTGTTDGEFRMWLLSGGSRVSDVYVASEQDGYTTSGTFEFTVTMTVNGGDSGGTSANAVMFKGPADGTLPTLTVTSVTIVTEDEADEDSAVATLEVNGTSTGWTIYGASYGNDDGNGTTYQFTSSELTTFVENLNQTGSSLVLTVDASSGWAQAGFNTDSGTSYYSSWSTYSECTVVTSEGYYIFTIDGQTLYKALASESWYELISNGGGLITAEIYVTSSSDDDDEETTVETLYEATAGESILNGSYASNNNYAWNSVSVDASSFLNAVYNTEYENEPYVEIVVSGVSSPSNLALIIQGNGNVSWASLANVLGTVSTNSDGNSVITISSSDLISALSASGYSTADEVVADWYSLVLGFVYNNGAAGDENGTLVSLKVLVDVPASAAAVLPTGYGLIYVNEEYHALVIQRQVGSVTRRFFVSIPHEDEDHDGYCDTCKEYIGTDDEEEEIATIIIDDVEYAVAYSYEDGISAGNWTQVDLGDLELIEALSEEGAILMITRDTETTVSFADGEYEKFLLIDSWWSNNQQPVSLGTAGHTSADEDVIDCVSDDGTVAIYDGATICEAWTEGGYDEGGSTLVFISNTSASYKIVSIQVLVPVE
ncbi:MAG: hypothetical protein LUF29_05535 [Oscillospiraceae bacterium]|nr:hypothetical protein [Oscillospiraceae bacterium]